jgi:hypothetical protein
MHPGNTGALPPRDMPGGDWGLFLNADDFLLNNMVLESMAEHLRTWSDVQTPHRTMEIVAGELSCYRLLAFISLKKELHWRANPVGKVRLNLPFFKKFAQES